MTAPVGHKPTIVGTVAGTSFVVRCTCRDEPLRVFESPEVPIDDIATVVGLHLADEARTVDFMVNVRGSHLRHVYLKDTRHLVHGLPGGGLSQWEARTLCGNVVVGREAGACPPEEIDCRQCRKVLRKRGALQ